MLKTITRLIAATALLCFAAPGLQAQAQALRFATVERPPFAMRDGTGEITGFSIDLMRALGDEIDREIVFEMVDTFPGMFEAMGTGQVDGAVANISITSEREAVMDFSQPIFDAGLQIMVPAERTGGGLLDALLRWELALSVAVAFLLLLGGGVLMWLFERGKQEYFNRPAREAMFPAFWWALNLVVNGGFEERIPQSRAGRVFAVFLVISSLFIVSIFVAQITAAMTVQAISGSIQRIGDLDGKRVATTRGSTASDYLALHDIAHLAYDDFETVLEAFEQGKLDAVVFDGPILAYYVKTRGGGKARMIDRVFRRESYGIALTQGSPLTEDINRALLTLRESGLHDEIARKWFGHIP